MIYRSVYSSPLGDMLIACDDKCLTGLWFFGAKYFAHGLPDNAVSGKTPITDKVCRWLDAYFAGEDPGMIPPVRLNGTDFQKAVWEELCKIPYGQTVTYGSIAEKIARQRGSGKLSAQAVGNAVGQNRISVIVPCHRVVGDDGSLCGYAGGILKKAELLRLEGVII